MIEERVDTTDRNTGEEKREPGVECQKPRFLKKRISGSFFFQKGGTGGRKPGNNGDRT